MAIYFYFPLPLLPPYAIFVAFGFVSFVKNGVEEALGAAASSALLPVYCHYAAHFLSPHMTFLDGTPPATSPPCSPAHTNQKDIYQPPHTITNLTRRLNIYDIDVGAAFPAA